MLTNVVNGDAGKPRSFMGRNQRKAPLGESLHGDESLEKENVVSANGRLMAQT